MGTKYQSIIFFLYDIIYGYLGDLLRCEVGFNRENEFNDEALIESEILESLREDRLDVLVEVLLVG